MNPTDRRRPGANGAASHENPGAMGLNTKGSPIGLATSVSDAAALYAEQGVPVFPCRPGEKSPLTAHGFRDATTDRVTIERWWLRWPLANLAMPTGPTTFDVLDIDVRSTGSGFKAFERLKRAGLLIGALAIVQTPSGGRHIYFDGSEQRSGSLPGRFIDFKAAGGYVLVPPSRVGSQAYVLIESRDHGRQFDWPAAKALLETTTATCSYAPVGRSEQSSGHRRRADGLIATVREATEGNRNRALFWAACRAVDDSLSAEVFDDLRSAAIANGLPVSEVDRTIASARRAGEVRTG